MITEFHFIRPLWLITLLPLLILVGYLLRQKPVLLAWREICDSHLLAHLMQTKGYSKRTSSLLLLLVSAFFMILSLAGPTWSRLPVPTYKQIQPRIIVLDMSESMLAQDLSPDRLSRAKFKLHDLFTHHDAGQFGLIVYSGDAFIVSPLTDDGQTIDSLLSTLTVDIMPVEGQRLETALDEAGKLIKQAGFQRGEVLVLSAEPPSSDAIQAAQELARQGIHTSVMPVMNEQSVNTAFQSLASAGRGAVIPFSDTGSDLEQWLALGDKSNQYSVNLQNDIPVWRDQGRWFLIPALFLLLPLFRRGWLQRINT